MADKKIENNVKIVGVLVENGVKAGTYKNEKGETLDYLGGIFTVRVRQTVSGKEEVNDIPVYLWAGRKTKSGADNPAYDSVAKAVDTFASIAATGDESTATKVMINSGQLSENIFSTDGEQVACTPRIRGTFVRSVSANPTEFTPEATFNTDLIVGLIKPETTKEGIETGRLLVKGMIPRWDGVFENFDFVVENRNAIDYISSYWTSGKTVRVQGKIRFSSKTIIEEVATNFGDPVKKSKTIVNRDLIITAEVNSDDIKQFTQEEIEAGMKKRLEAIEKEKEKAKARSKKVQASGANNVTSAPNYGF